MTNIEREDMSDFDNQYKLGIVSHWELNKKIDDGFLNEIWEASTKILPNLEVQVVIDANDKLHISSGSGSYVDFEIDPTGMKLPIRCWIHTHPFGKAYWSGIDWRTIDTWRPMMKKAIVLGNNERGIWYNTLKGRNWIWENSEGVQKMNNSMYAPKICPECIDNERLLELLLDFSWLEFRHLDRAKELLENELYADSEGKLND
jgi:hypothetical protein|tara:strand:+ start:621 stop:1229 length:609 start_codon:yes stop_codon:yes gene_type:complete